MNLFLDDTRIQPRSADWQSTDDYYEFIGLINKYVDCLETVDLDYNIGDDSLYNGYHVLKYMKDHSIRCTHINVHSTHETGRDLMLNYAKSNFTDIKVTGDPWP